jgi:hypothetical protein
LLRTGALAGGYVHQAAPIDGERDDMRLILIIILVLLLIGSFPVWPYSMGWGYYPTGGLGLLVVIVIVVLFLG